MGIYNQLKIITLEYQEGMGKNKPDATIKTTCPITGDIDEMAPEKKNKQKANEK